MTPKQMAPLGVFHIEEAILDTLFQADDREPVAPVEDGDFGVGCVV